MQLESGQGLATPKKTQLFDQEDDMLILKSGSKRKMDRSQASASPVKKLNLNRSGGMTFTQP